jgi:hypothetical protein
MRTTWQFVILKICIPAFSAEVSSVISMSVASAASRVFGDMTVAPKYLEKFLPFGSTIRGTEQFFAFEIPQADIPLVATPFS